MIFEPGVGTLDPMAISFKGDRLVSLVGGEEQPNQCI